MSEVINFIIWWTVFLGFIFWVQTIGASSVISGYNTADTSTWATFINLFNITTGYNWINVLLLVPFFATLSYIIACLLRGVSP